jgi:ribosomal protein L19
MGSIPITRYVAFFCFFIMFSDSINKLDSLQKINFMILKSFFFGRITIKGYKKTSLNYFFRVGDIITMSIVRLEKSFKTLQKKPTSQKVVGRVIAKYRKNIHSFFILRNVYAGVPIEYTFTIYSPMILSLRVLHIHRRMQYRSKVYFFRELSNPRNRIKFKFVNKTLKLRRYKQRSLSTLNFKYQNSKLFSLLKLILILK